LIAGRLYLERRGQRTADLRQLLIDAVDDVDGRGFARLEHAHEHRTAAVHPHHVGLRGISVADVGDIANVSHRAVLRPDRHVVEVLDPRRTRVELEEVLERPDLLGARR
jgi:hypothetical protein